MEIINIDVFKLSLRMFYGQSEQEEFNNYCGGFENIESTSDSLQLVTKGMNFQNCIWINDSNHLPELLETVVHEVSHFVDWVFSTRGFKCTETRAYLSGYLFREIYDIIYLRGK